MRSIIFAPTDLGEELANICEFNHVPMAITNNVHDILHSNYRVMSTPAWHADANSTLRNALFDSCKIINIGAIYVHSTDGRLLLVQQRQYNHLTRKTNVGGKRNKTKFCLQVTNTALRPSRRRQQSTLSLIKHRKDLQRSPIVSVSKHLMMVFDTAGHT
jgi:hypothetical protein